MNTIIMNPCRLIWACVMLLLLLPISVAAQTEFKGKALPESVNTEYDELVPRLAPDDQTLYFVRHQHPGNVGGRGGGQDIWYATRNAEGGWNNALNAGPVVNNMHHNFVGGVVLGGAGLILGNTYGSTPESTAPGFSLSRKEGEAWGKPETMGEESSLPEKSRYLDFYCTPDMKIMILSKMADEGVQEDLYVSRYEDGAWTSPISLGSIINSTGYETGPFLSADTKRLFFTSNGHAGEGDADIFLAERLDDTWENWSEPVNLGKAVNTAGFDGHFILDSKETMAYFVSGPSPTALGDIYEIPYDEISALRKTTPDTLRIDALAGVPMDVDLERFGITPRNTNFVGLRPLNSAKGSIKKGPNDGDFVYNSADNFQGVEYHEIELCDPPQSDNCHKVILEAHVTAPNQPTLKRYVLRTPKNTQIGFEPVIEGISLPETKRGYRILSGPKGEITTPNGNSPTFLYRPALDFVGIDSIPVFGRCPNGETMNCLLAMVKVEVYEVPTVIVAIDSPKAKDITISGTVTDEKTGQPLGAEIVFYKGKIEVGKVSSNVKNGRYSILLPAGFDYAVEAKQPYYLPYSDFIPSAKGAGNGSLVKDIAMSPIPMEAGQTFVLKNIYFDTDKAILKPQSKEELTRLYELLQNYPTMEIEVRGHTDSDGSDAHNQALSDARAFSVINYVKYKGIMGYRLSSKGFGEKVPVSTNETVDGKALNRRVEFFILKM